MIAAVAGNTFGILCPPIFPLPDQIGFADQRAANAKIFYSLFVQNTLHHLNIMVIPRQDHRYAYILTHCFSQIFKA